MIKLVEMGDLVKMYHYSRTPKNYGKKIKRLSGAGFEKSSTSGGNRKCAIGDVHSRVVPAVRRVDNGERARRSLQELIITNEPRPEKTLFLTPTYAENMCDIRRAVSDYRLFVKRLQYIYPNIKIIGTYERQQRGAYHFHMLVWGITPPQTVQDWRVLKSSLERVWGNGFCKVKAVYGHASFVANYVCKYITKERALRNDGMRVRSFYYTRNCARPRVSRYSSLQDFNQEYTSIGVPLFAKSMYNGYTGFISCYILNKSSLCNFKRPSQLLALPQVSPKQESLTPESLCLMGRRLSPLSALQRESHYRYRLS